MLSVTETGRCGWICLHGSLAIETVSVWLSGCRVWSVVTRAEVYLAQRAVSVTRLATDMAVSGNLW